ncbi:MAG: hypothetical protein FJ191_00800 [Gammaproteobacteria bacterium]|nr:hypothetical protein [Gammaproteobacteria bacterium]
MQSNLAQRLSAHLCTVLVVAALAAPAALAYEITYDFTAIGYFGTYTGVGFETTPSASEEISGSVTFNVLSVAPPPEPDAFFNDDHTRAYDNYSGNWVRTEFSGTSSRGSIAPVPVGEECGVDGYVYGPLYFVEVNNNTTLDVNTYSNQSSFKQYQCYSNDGLTSSGRRRLEALPCCIGSCTTKYRRTLAWTSMRAGCRPSTTVCTSGPAGSATNGTMSIQKPFQTQPAVLVPCSTSIPQAGA